MSMNATLFRGGRRLRLQEGPIDLVIEAWGESNEVAAAYAQAVAAFDGLLAGLTAELPLLRQPLGDALPALNGSVARRMAAACWPHRAAVITPMAAVAGAVADHVLTAMCRNRVLSKAYVNDGGDIAFHLNPNEQLICGMIADLRTAGIAGTILLTAALPVRGIATSGAPTKGSGGRSFSLGIADAVTVLAESAADADAAATIIANAVDLPDHPGIVRVPAWDLDPDSDLRDRLVTVTVPRLDASAIDKALRAGRKVADSLRAAGNIYGAVLALKDRFVVSNARERPLLAA
jgi:ApbE superfamily uncharacterized protein (UPF0280 family)